MGEEASGEVGGGVGPPMRCHQAIIYPIIYYSSSYPLSIILFIFNYIYFYPLSPYTKKKDFAVAA